jgi:hypothetical protein
MTMGDRVAVMKNGRISNARYRMAISSPPNPISFPSGLRYITFRTLFGCCHRSTNQTWSLLRHGR